MRLKTQKLHNYCQYADMTIEFEDGLAVLLGKNGSGKSNLLNSVFYALTGESAIENKTRPKMLKWGTKKGYIELTFDVDTVEYVLKRNLQSATAKMEWEIDGKKHSLNKATEINIKMMELMQTDANTLLLSSFMPQKGSNKLIFGTTVERMKEYSRLFRLLHLEKIRDLLRACSNKVETYQDFSSEIAEATAKRDDAKLAYEEQKNSLDQQTELLEDLRDKYNEAMKKSAGMTKVAWEGTKKAIEDEINKLRDEHLEKLGLLEDLGQPVTLTPEDIDEYNKFIAAKEYGARVLELKEQIAAIDLPTDPPMLTFTKEELDTAVQNALKYKAKYDAYLGKKCPTCDQPAEVSNKELWQMKEDMEKSEEFVKHLREQEQEYITKAAEYTALQQELLGLESDYAVELSRFKELSTMVENFNQEAYMAKRAQSAKTQETQERRTQLEARINQLTPMLENKEAELVKHLDVGYFEEGGEDDQFIDHFEKLRDVMIPESKEKVASLTTEISMIDKQIAEKEGFTRLWRECEEYKEYLQNIRDILHVDNFPKKMISAYRPLLQKLVSKYLSIFKQPFCIDIDEQLAVVCSFPDNPEVSVSDLSGGQQMLLTVAFRLAIAEMTTSNVSFISMDEPTNHLDADSKEYLAETFGLVKEYLKTSKIQMIVSTHEPRIQTVADYTIEV